MRNTSNEYKEYVTGNNLPRNFTAKATITLIDNTVLHITEEDIVVKGLKINDSVSPGGSFQIGSAIINQCTLMLNNVENKFNEYDFTDAIIIPYIGLRLNQTIEWIKMGIFTTDETTVANSIISLVALDNMNKFDAPLSELDITYPITAFNLLYEACLHCRVSLNALNFTNMNFIITRPLDDEATTCREVVAWIAQISGNFARCNVDGSLELKWYDIGAFEQSDNLDGGRFDNIENTSFQTGDSANGGDFTNYNSGDNVDGGTFLQMDRYHHIYALNQATIYTDDIIITGIQVKAMGTEEDYGETVLFGSKGYVIEITDNPLIIENTASIISNSIGPKIVGMKFRPMTINALADPSREAGDAAYVSHKNNSYPSFITTIAHNIGSHDNIACEAESPSKKQSVRFSPQTKAIIEARKIAKEQLTAYDLAVQQLNGLMTNAMGYYPSSEILEDGSRIDYAHDKPTLAESMIIWKKTINGFATSIDGGKTWTSGMTADGNIIAKTLAVIGINAEWIKVLTSFTVGSNFSVDAVGNLIAKSGKIGPFTMNSTGLFSDSMSFYDNSTTPWIWLSKRGDMGGEFPQAGSSRANYEPDVWSVRNVDGEVLTDLYAIAREGESGKIGYIGIDKSDKSNGRRISEVRLSENGLQVDNYSNGDISKTHSLNDYGVSWNDYDTGNSSNMYVDTSSGDMYIQSSNKIYINGRNIEDIESMMNQQFSSYNDSISRMMSDIIAIKIKLGMPIN